MFVVGGFFFSSCILIFGQRTYPWLLRKNRDPNNCKNVDPEVIIIEEEDDYYEDEEINMNSSESSSDSFSLGTYNKLENELMEAKQTLLESEEKLLVAIDRAEKAEAMVRAFNSANDNDNDKR